jgi:1-deoxy-D-xylulose-5-phosphate synthase
MTQNHNDLLENILSNINTPEDIRGFSISELEQLCQELRKKTIEVVSKTGGHLGPGLGVIELTVALHYVFNTPEDLLVWDIGHQSYPHKILTNRQDHIHTIRQPQGLSGFTKRAESIYDPFGAGHSSTSISAALGMAAARDLNGQAKEVIAVIGDGAISAGMAYEAMNNAGWLKNRLIVILNDNDMSIAPPVGAMSKYLSRLIASSPYLNFRNMAKQVFSYLPKTLEEVARKTERYAKAMVSNGNFFSELGFYYVGPIDGHDLSNLIPILTNIKNDQTIKHPILIHVVTEKGKGFAAKEACSEKFHAVSSFNLDTGLQEKAKSLNPTYTKVFANALIEQATKDEKIVAITAAMPSGTGLSLFAEKFPTRMFDVGIAEQHAVTFAAGLACEGLKPFVAIYSTFLQRAYDQIVHDVVLQKLPVRFAIDRAGYVGADGPTHAGAFDITFLATLPNIILMAPSDEHELVRMVELASKIDHLPCAFRYPRGEVSGVKEIISTPLALGRGRIIKQGKNIAILSLGTMLKEVKKASCILQNMDIDVTIADARFIKPLDTALIGDLVKNHHTLLVIEDGSSGGFAAQVMTYIANNLSPKAGFKIRTMHHPDRFIEQNTVAVMYQEAGLAEQAIVKIILNSRE